MKKFLCAGLYLLMSLWSWQVLRRSATLGPEVRIDRCPLRKCLDRPYSIGIGVTIGRKTHVEGCASIGDYAQIGEHCLIRAGAVIGRHAVVENHTTVDGFVPDHAIVSGSPCQLLGFSAHESDSPATCISLRGSAAMKTLAGHFTFESILDIGSGAGDHARFFMEQGKSVTCIDLGSSVYFDSNDVRNVIKADYLEHKFGQTFDCIWACHILEHQPNPNIFLKKVYADLTDDGILAITVPPLKYDIVGGHVTLWNAGILLYHLILAGFDCAEAAVLSEGYDISVIVRKKAAILPKLDYDKGDIEKLRKFFPCAVTEGFDGRIIRCRWPLS